MTDGVATMTMTDGVATMTMTDGVAITIAIDSPFRTEKTHAYAQKPLVQH
jgi:hypothetical protein